MLFQVYRFSIKNGGHRQQQLDPDHEQHQQQRVHGLDGGQREPLRRANVGGGYPEPVLWLDQSHRFYWQFSCKSISIPIIMFSQVFVLNYRLEEKFFHGLISKVCLHFTLFTFEGDLRGCRVEEDEDGDQHVHRELGLRRRHDRGVCHPVPVPRSLAPEVGPAGLHVPVLSARPDLEREHQHLHPGRHLPRQVRQQHQ